MSENIPNCSDTQTSKPLKTLNGCALGELVYTSAPKVLKSQGGHLGIVAETRDFPPEIERQLSQFWSFSLPRELRLPENAIVPRFVLVPAGVLSPAISLTRVQSAGFDHTGRTHPIAHHYFAELTSLEASGLSIADLVLWATQATNSETPPVFFDKWIGEPTHLDKRRVYQAADTASPFAIVDQIKDRFEVNKKVLEAAVLCTADAIMDYDKSERMVVVVVKPTAATSILHFIAAVLCSLPKQKQSLVAATSHVWDLNDAPSGFTLTFTYPRSPYLERIKQRIDSKKPIVIDLAMKVPEVPRSENSYASYLRSDRERWDAKINLPIPRLFDQVDTNVKSEALVYSLKGFLQKWDSNYSYESLAAMCTKSRSCIAQGLQATGIGQLVWKAGQRTIAKLVETRNWEELFATSSDPQIANELRVFARDCIERNITSVVAEAPGVIAQAAFEFEGTRLMELLARTSGVNLDPVFSIADTLTFTLPDTKVCSGIANWSILGTTVLRYAWRRISLALSNREVTSQFCRRILDLLIPTVVARAVIKDIAEPGVTAKDEVRVNLESVLVPAWRILSHQIQAGTGPHALCKKIVEELVSEVEVATSTEQLVKQAVREHQQASMDIELTTEEYIYER